jgi:hypothetical protein
MKTRQVNYSAPTSEVFASVEQAEQALRRRSFVPAPKRNRWYRAEGDTGTWHAEIVNHCGAQFLLTVLVHDGRALCSHATALD